MVSPFTKKDVCGADAEGEFNRSEFGMTKYADGKEGMIHLRIQVEAVKND
jgi:polyisoprenoid-binding protein YceI